MQDFIKDIESQDSDHESVTFKHWDREVTFFKPSEGQQMLMLSLGGRNSMDTKSAAKFVSLFISLGDDDTQNYIMDLMETRNSGFTLKSKGGLFDIWEKLQEEWSGKDSTKRSGSRKSASATGATSTASTRRRASTSARSRSTSS